MNLPAALQTDGIPWVLKFQPVIGFLRIFLQVNLYGTFNMN